jgi:DNA-directed RNA polymerase subunit K/omega
MEEVKEIENEDEMSSSDYSSSTDNNDDNESDFNGSDDNPDDVDIGDIDDLENTINKTSKNTSKISINKKGVNNQTNNKIDGESAEENDEESDEEDDEESGVGKKNKEDNDDEIEEESDSDEEIEEEESDSDEEIEEDSDEESEQNNTNNQEKLKKHNKKNNIKQKSSNRTQLNIEKSPIPNLNEIDSDIEDDIEDETYLQKFENTLKTNIITQHHPELNIKNFEEIEVLSKIIKNDYGVIIDNNHKTLPFITKYERARVIGERAKQIDAGSKIFIEIDTSIIDGYVIALEEYKQKKIPFIIQRPIPNGKCEYWRFCDLEQI